MSISDWSSDVCSSDLRNRLIVRLDVLARNEELQEKLASAREWDLIICDEAHRMSATYFGGDVKYTKRYQVGQKLGEACRHLLLMSATPHNGTEEDFPPIGQAACRKGECQYG